MGEPETTLQFDCPLCEGAFEIASQWLGHEVECPHCGGTVVLEAAEPAPPSAPEPPPPQPAPAPPPAAEHPSATEQLTLGMEQAEPVAERPVLDQQPTPEPAPQPAPKPDLPPLTPEERAALRRRVNQVFAVVGVLVLVGSFVLLTWLVG